MIVFVVETLGGWQLLLIRMMLIILKRIMLIILSVLITWFTHSLRIEAAPLSHSLSYLFEVNTYHHPHYHHRHHHDHHPHHQRNDDDQVRDAHSQRSIRNVTTTEPKVALVDLPPSSDFVILVRWGDDMMMMIYI